MRQECQPRSCTWNCRSSSEIKLARCSWANPDPWRSDLFQRRRETTTNIKHDGFEPVALIFGAQVALESWQGEDLLLPLAGGGHPGRRVVKEALAGLEQRGL